MNRTMAACVGAVTFGIAWSPAAVAQEGASQPAPEAAAADEAKPLTAEQVLAKMGEAYRKCETYQDEGEVEIKFDTKQGKWTDRRPFKTAFHRGGKFKYEFTSKVGPYGKGPTSRYVVWNDGEQIRSWWSLQRRVERHDSILMALAGPTGVSGGSAIRVPSLLYNMEGMPRYGQLTQPKLVGEEQVDGTLCHKLTGEQPARGPVTLWLETRTFLIRRIREDYTFIDFTTAQTTTYKPKVGAEIPDEVFRFTPPGGEE